MFTTAIITGRWGDTDSYDDHGCYRDAGCWRSPPWSAGMGPVSRPAGIVTPTRVDGSMKRATPMSQSDNEDPPPTPESIAEQIAALTRIAFWEGFRQGASWVHDSFNAEGQQRAWDWSREHATGLSQNRKRDALR